MHVDDFPDAPIYDTRQCLHVNGSGDFPPRCVRNRGHDGAHQAAGNRFKPDTWPNTEQDAA